MDWMKVTLSRQDVRSQEKWEAVREIFEQRFKAMGGPLGAALFHAHEGNESTLFFSPASSELMKDYVDIFGSVACQPPSREGLALLVGDEAASWDLLKD